jgi:hypothetical protein
MKHRRSRLIGWPNFGSKPRISEILAPSTAGSHSGGGQRFESPQLHQEVHANRRDFLVRR